MELKEIRMKNKRGQSRVLFSIIITVIAVIIFVALIPSIKNPMDIARGCNYLNCGGYIDPDASGSGCTSQNRSYNVDIQEDQLTCVVWDIFLPIFILIVLSGLVFKATSGGVESQQVQQFPQY